MACPQVEGAAGLVRSANPQLRNEDIRRLFARCLDRFECQHGELVLAVDMPLIPGRWTMDAEKESPERIELKFQEDGTFDAPSAMMNTPRVITCPLTLLKYVPQRFRSDQPTEWRLVRRTIRG